MSRRRQRKLDSIASIANRSATKLHDVNGAADLNVEVGAGADVDADADADADVFVLPSSVPYSTLRNKA